MTDSRRWQAIEQDLRRVGVPDDEAAVERVMRAIRETASERPSPALDTERPRDPQPAWLETARAPRVFAWLTRRSIRVAPVHLLAALLLIAVGVAVLARPRSSGTPTSSVAAGPARQAAATVVSSQAGPDGRREVRFVFVADSATRVAVAGDFNDWNPQATPLSQLVPGGIWSGVVRVPPGRHLYAFVVNDSTWVIDMTAPRAPETEFGGESSVLFVSRES